MLEWKSNRRILIGISGGISAYKIPEIIRAIRKNGNDVEVILTQSATSFILYDIYFDRQKGMAGRFPKQ